MPPSNGMQETSSRMAGNLAKTAAPGKENGSPARRLRADEATVLRIVESVASVDVGDGVSFRRDSAPQTSIVKDDEYGGWSIGLIAEFGTIRLPVSIDVTYGDAITPGAVPRDFAGILDDSLRIRLRAYTTKSPRRGQSRPFRNRDLRRGAGQPRRNVLESPP